MLGFIVFVFMLVFCSLGFEDYMPASFVETQETQDLQTLLQRAKVARTQAEGASRRAHEFMVRKGLIQKPLDELETQFFGCTMDELESVHSLLIGQKRWERQPVTMRLWTIENAYS